MSIILLLTTYVAGNAYNTCLYILLYLSWGHCYSIKFFYPLNFITTWWFLIKVCCVIMDNYMCRAHGTNYVMEWSKNLRKFLATENSTSRIRHQILGYYSQEFLKNSSVVIIIVSTRKSCFDDRCQPHIYGFMVDGMVPLTCNISLATCRYLRAMYSWVCMHSHDPYLRVTIQILRAYYPSLAYTRVVL